MTRILITGASGFIGRAVCKSLRVAGYSISGTTGNIEKKRGMYGTFYEYDCSNINEIAGIISTKFQTLTYFGIEKSRLSNFVLNNRLSGIDRIVPVGRALDIDIIWDGFDIEKNLSRIIDIK